MLTLSSSTARLTGLLDNRKCRGTGFSVSGSPNCGQRPRMCRVRLLGRLLFSRLQLSFNGRRSAIVISRPPRAVCFFFRHGYGIDKLVKPFAVTLRGDWRNLCPIVRKALDKMLYPFHHSILRTSVTSEQHDNLIRKGKRSRRAGGSREG